MAETTLQHLAALVNGELIGAPSTKVFGAATLDTATTSDITFADAPKLLEKVQNASIAAVVVPTDFPNTGKASIVVENPREAFSKIVRFFRPPRTATRTGVSRSAFVSESAIIGDDVTIYPGAHIGDEVVLARGCTVHPNVCIMAGCRVDEHATLFPNVVLYENSIIGKRVVVHSGAVIGAYGFGYDTVQGRHEISDQLGYVEIQDDVEIGACSTIDRGTYGRTLIGEGTKIDNQVMIAHNCQIGKHNLICSQVGVAGSSSTGDYVVMAGQVGVPDHCRIGHRAILGAKSGIMRDVPDDTTVLGIPATPERDQMTKLASIQKLPEMRKQLRRLQRVVDELTKSEPVVQTDAA